MTQSVGTTIPLTQRKVDFFFILIFALFAYTSFSGDASHALGLVNADGSMSEGNRWYIEASKDLFFAANHEFTRISTGISAFVYGPFYLLLVYAFIAGKNWIRPLAFLYTGAIVQGTFQYIWWEFTIGPAPGVPLIFWIFNGPYIVIPLLLALRMWKHQPFSHQNS